MVIDQWPAAVARAAMVRDGKGLAVNPPEAEIVRMILGLANRHHTGSQVAQALNAKGSTRRNGKSWTPRRVAAILSRREFYTAGILRYGDAQEQNPGLALLNLPPATRGR